MSIQKKIDDADALDIDTSLPVKNIEKDDFESVGIVDTPYPPPEISKSYHPFQPGQIKRKETQLQRKKARKERTEKKENEKQAELEALQSVDIDTTSPVPIFSVGDHPFLFQSEHKREIEIQRNKENQPLSGGKRKKSTKQSRKRSHRKRKTKKSKKTRKTRRK